MRCPKCKSDKIVVIYTESFYDTVTYRYRKCKLCMTLWKTTETVDEETVKILDSEKEHQNKNSLKLRNLIKSVW